MEAVVLQENGMLMDGHVLGLGWISGRGFQVRARGFVQERKEQAIVKRKWTYLERYIFHRQNEDFLRKGELAWHVGLLVFMVWIMLWANKWEDYSNDFGEGVGISRNWATAQFFGL